MSQLNLQAQTAATTQTPSTGYYGFFVNSATNSLYYKNSSGVSLPVGGTTSPNWVNAVTIIGLDSTGTTDGTATLNTYLSTASNIVIYFPPGTYKFGAGNTAVSSSGGGIIFLGDGINTTNFETTSATADIIDFSTNWYNTVQGINFKTTVTRTAGYAINFGTTNYGFVNNCQFVSMFNNINISGNLNIISDCFFGGTINFGISVSGATNNSYINNCTWTAQGSIPAGSAGINVTQCGSLIISDCDIISMASGLLLNPTSPNGCFSVQVTDSFFDTCTTGINFTGTGNIQRCLFDTCWAGDSVNGFASTNTSATPPVGIMFTGCFFELNSANGMLCTDMGDFNVVGCTMGGNTTSGITLSAVATNQTRFTITGCNIGTMGGSAAQGTGIIINSGTYGSYIITGNTITGNTNGAISDSGSVTGQNQKIIHSNVGHLPIAGISTTTAASSGLNTTETIVAGGLNNAVVPANSLRVGTVVRVVMPGSCAASAAGTSTFTLRVGTAGTTADASVAIASMAGTTGTTLFKAIMEFVVTGTGTAGTILGNIAVANGAATGISTSTNFNEALTATATLNTTTANYLEVTYKSGATTTTSTFSAPCYVEIVKT